MIVFLLILVLYFYIGGKIVSLEINTNEEYAEKVRESNILFLIREVIMWLPDFIVFLHSFDKDDDEDLYY